MIYGELQKRAEKVFLLDEGDIVISVEGNKYEFKVHIINTIKDIDITYLPDMLDRPEAVDYLLGKRDDFND